MQEDAMPDSIPYTDEHIAGILTDCKTIAVVGLDSAPERWSNVVARYLLEQGYTIIPVNPVETEVFGLKAYPDLKSIPVPIDMVDIFRRVEFIPAHVDEAIAVGAKVVWMQDELIHQESAAKARDAGMTVVMDTCTARRHRNLKAAGKL
ncbi:MAG: CoA-binding protein [Chloroflexi bacterium]|nr:CoA-binding protein [Chloroflexota bacterium]